jgi:hypothetical protein
MRQASRGWVETTRSDDIEGLLIADRSSRVTADNESARCWFRHCSPRSRIARESDDVSTDSCACVERACHAIGGDRMPTMGVNWRTHSPGTGPFVMCSRVGCLAQTGAGSGSWLSATRSLVPGVGSGLDSPLAPPGRAGSGPSPITCLATIESRKLLRPARKQRIPCSGQWWRRVEAHLPGSDSRPAEGLVGLDLPAVLGADVVVVMCALCVLRAGRSAPRS